MATVNRKYFGPRALVAVVRMLLGFDRRIAEAETAVGKAVEDAEARMDEAVAAASEATTAATEIAGEAAGGERMRAEAESGRVTAESGRVESEEERRRNEQSRMEAESSRAAGEADRIEGERVREVVREKMEITMADCARAEAERNEAETLRLDAELRRESAEALRERTENERREAESGRATEFESWKTEIDSKADRSELKEYANRTEVTQDLNAKQDKLSTTTDLHITDDNIIGLTEAAKVKLFDDMWEAAYGTVIVSGVTYGCNGIDDLTLAEAMAIMAYYTPRVILDMGAAFTGATCRTFLPIKTPSSTAINFDSAFRSCSKLKKVVFKYSSQNAPDPTKPPKITVGGCGFMFYDCGQLEEIEGILELGNNKAALAFHRPFGNCRNLREVRVAKVHTNLDIKECAKLSLASVEYMVANATNTAAIVITVHADVYAKLTGDTTNEAAAALTAEELAQWQQVCLDANARNIAFATA